MVKSAPADAIETGDASLIPESGRSPGEESGNPLQYSCLENSLDRAAWWATVHGVAKSRTQLSTHTCAHFTSLLVRFFFFFNFRVIGNLDSHLFLLPFWGHVYGEV